MMRVKKKSKVYKRQTLTAKRAKKAFKDLSKFIELLPHSFLTYGSCLASHRENEFIPWDTDTDTGILAKDFKWDYINTLIKNKFKITRIYGIPEFGLQFVFYRNVKIDLWLFYEEDNNYYNCLWDKQKPIKHVYSKELLVLDKGMLYNKEFASLSTDYLEHVYGNWKQPQKQFSWKTDHKCIETG